MKRLAESKMADTTKREADAHKALELAIASITKNGGDDAPAKLAECFKQFHAYLSKGEQPQETEMTNEEISKLVAEQVAAGVAAAIAEYEKKKTKPDPQADDEDADDMSDKQARDLLGKVFGKDGAQDIIDGLANKSAPSPVMPDDLAKRDAEIVDLRKHVAELTASAQRAEFAKRAESIGLTGAEGEQLRKAYAGDVTALKFLEDTIGKLHVQVQKAGLFNEVGTAGGSPATPHDELMAKAAEIRKSQPKLTEAQAYVQAMSQNPELVKREREQAHARIQKVAQ